MNQSSRLVLPVHSLREFNSVLLRLYDYAGRLSLDDFQAGAVREMRRLIRFDGCWWGIGTLIEGHHRIHHSFVEGLPEDMATAFNDADDRNIVGRRCSRRPGRALVFGPQDLAGNEETWELARRARIAQVLCACTLQETSHLVMFVSLSRRRARPAFSPTEAGALELLLPHLESMLQLSRVLDITRQRIRQAGTHICLAVTDVRGILHVAEPGFDRIVREEWPTWQGPALPAEVVAAIGARRARYRGHSVTLEFQWIGSQVVAAAHPCDRRDSLTPQERRVADVFAAGRNYKEVARLVGISPATVRHHLRAVYVKLGVRDKAALARTLG